MELSTEDCYVFSFFYGKIKMAFLSYFYTRHSMTLALGVIFVVDLMRNN